MAIDVELEKRQENEGRVVHSIELMLLKLRTDRFPLFS